MTNYVSSITIDQVIDALAAFILPFLGTGGQTIRGQQNRVALPNPPVAVLTELGQFDLNFPYMDFTNLAAGTADIDASTRIDVQVDIYGPLAGSQCKAVKSAFRSEYGFNAFPAYVKPLYTDDGREIPLITGEQQYERRWTLTATMQYNPTVTVPQQSADVLSVHEIIDANLPP